MVRPKMELRNKIERGGTHEQHVKAGQQSHKNEGDQRTEQSRGGNDQSGGQRGGSDEQHVKAGQQSHKND
jgi:hypothetical protein